MTNRQPLDKLCKLLAASGFSDVEIRKMLEELQYTSTYEVLSSIREIRRKDPGFYSPQIEEIIPNYKVTSVKLDDEISRKVDQLLRNEAGLTTERAVKELAIGIYRHFPKQQVPAYIHKKSFITWINKLCSVFPPKDILFLATQIRNKIVHKKDSDWGLK